MVPAAPPAAAERAPRRSLPTLRVERALRREGYTRVAGVDEVGRGPLAGPVVAAAVVLPERPARWLSELRDSKLLSPRQRERLAELVRRHCEWGISTVSAQVIDQIGIGPATRLAMRRAVLALPWDPAAASIIAKVARDAMMVELDARLPGYGFARHVGYATAEHRERLDRLGYSTAHRLTFEPVRRTLAARAGGGAAQR